MNCISYSIFGFNKKFDNSFPFVSYLRLFSLNMRMAELIYPNWRIHLVTDNETYNSKFNGFFKYHNESGHLDITVIEETDPLCMMMLRRLMPVFDAEYDRVICRDADSLLCYRERQAVDYWIKTGRVVHAITDSISHNISLMGGMVGFTSKQFREIVAVESFKELVKLGRYINYSVKGADQTFLNNVILPKVAHTMVEHYIEGMPQSFRGECFNYIQDIVIQDIKPELKESNLLIEHIGQSGFIIEPVLKFLDKHQTAIQKEYYKGIDSQFKEIHYWLL